MIESGKDIERLLSQFLRPEGFRKKGKSWYLDTPEVVVFVNLQRSQWGKTYYLNFGALVKSIRNEPYPIRDRTRPKPGESHYTIRIQDLFPGRPIPPAKVTPDWMRTHALLDFYSPVYDAEEREQEQSKIFEERLVPFLRLCRTESGVKKAIMEMVRSSHGTSGVLRDHLDIPLGAWGD